MNEPTTRRRRIGERACCLVTSGPAASVRTAGWQANGCSTRSILQL